MKKWICIPLFVLIVACGGNGVENDAGTTDSIGSTPSAIDTAQHPNGVTNGSVISTDTAAMRVDTNAADK